MTERDLMAYLRLISVWTNRNKLDVQYQGATDMTKQLEQMAVEAMVAYAEHNATVNDNIFSADHRTNMLKRYKYTAAQFVKVEDLIERNQNVSQ